MTTPKTAAASGRMQRLVSSIFHRWKLYRLSKMMKKSIRLDQKIYRLGDNIEQWEKKNVNIDLPDLYPPKGGIKNH